MLEHLLCNDAAFFRQQLGVLFTVDFIQKPKKAFVDSLGRKSDGNRWFLLSLKVEILQLTAIRSNSPWISCVDCFVVF